MIWSILFLVIFVLLNYGIFKIFAYTAYKLNYNESMISKEFNDDHPELTGPNTNTISYGLYTTDGQLINEQVLIPENNKLESIFSISHYINENRSYLLLVLTDFKQSEFEVLGKKILTYEFTMKPNEQINFPVSLEINDKTREVNFVLIKKPYYLLHESDIKLAANLQEVITLRYRVEQPKNIQIMNVNIPKYERSLKTYTNGSNDQIFISDSMEKLKILYESRHDKDSYLHVGNLSDTETNYALVALLDWQQVPLWDTYENFVSIKPNSRKVYKLNFPYSEDEKNYQILAFPMPYNVNDDDFRSQMTYSTFRTILYD